MNKLSKSFVCTAAAIGLLTVTGIGSTSVALADTATTKGTLVALGDSITFGYNLADTQNNTVSSAYAFAAVMGHDDHYQVTNLGVPGWTSTDLLNQLQTANFVNAVKGANVITLDIGSNDLLHLAGEMGLLTAAQQSPSTPITLTPQQQQQFADAITQFGKNLAAIFAGIRQNSSAPIVLYNLYDPFPSQSALHATTEVFQSTQNQMIAQLAAAQKNVVVADAHKAFDGNQMTDVRVANQDVHPTVQGQLVLAQTGEAALKLLLSANPSPTPNPTPTPTGPTTVPGATTPNTGLPVLTQGLAAIILLAIGGWFVAYSRRRSHSK